MIDKIQEHVDAKPHAYAYVLLAKLGLWLVSINLVSVIVSVFCFAAFQQDFEDALPVRLAMMNTSIQACQVLSIIAITVLGYHGYTGTHLLHTLRHWNDK
jgi:hypothetical protein